MQVHHAIDHQTLKDKTENVSHHYIFSCHLLLNLVCQKLGLLIWTPHLNYTVIIQQLINFLCYLYMQVEIIIFIMSSF